MSEDKVHPEDLESMDKEGNKVIASGSGVVPQMEIQQPATFVGLGKEELMVLAGQPFWVRLRWTLLIFFWVLWIGLLVGAALLIALAPKCENKVEAGMKAAVVGGHGH